MKSKILTLLLFPISLFAQTNTVTRTLSAFDKIAVSGGYNGFVLKEGETFNLASSGSGNFKGEFDVQKLEIAISGSSNMNLSGKAENQEIAISGSGDVNASNLKGSEAEVAISGSGDLKLGVKGKVKTAVSGSGKVTNN